MFPEIVKYMIYLSILNNFACLRELVKTTFLHKSQYDPSGSGKVPNSWFLGAEVCGSIFLYAVKTLWVP